MRPASVRGFASPFVKKRDKAPGKKVELNWDIIELSNNHRLDIELSHSQLTNLRLQLRNAELAGKESKARKIRREINKWQETALAVENTWCGGCTNYLRNCQCQSFTEIQREIEDLDDSQVLQILMEAGL